MLLVILILALLVAVVALFIAGRKVFRKKERVNIFELVVGSIVVGGGIVLVWTVYSLHLLNLFNGILLLLLGIAFFSVWTIFNRYDKRVGLIEIAIVSILNYVFSYNQVVVFLLLMPAIAYLLHMARNKVISKSVTNGFLEKIGKKSLKPWVSTVIVIACLILGTVKYHYDMELHRASHRQNNVENNETSSSNSYYDNNNTQADYSSSSTHENEDNDYQSDDEDYYEEVVSEAVFSSFSIDPNTYLSNGEKAISAKFNVAVHNLKDHDLEMYMIPYDLNPDNYDSHPTVSIKSVVHRGTGGRQIYAKRVYDPIYEDSYWDNEIFSIPYKNFFFNTGTNTYYMRLEMFDKTIQKWVGRSNVVAFQMTYMPSAAEMADPGSSFIINAATGEVVPYGAPDLTEKKSTRRVKKTSRREKESRTPCSYCNGTGEYISTIDLTAHYGLENRYKWCEKCKKNVILGSHQHLPCPSCKGRRYK